MGYEYGCMECSRNGQTAANTPLTGRETAVMRNDMTRWRDKDITRGGDLQ